MCLFFGLFPSAQSAIVSAQNELKLSLPKIFVESVTAVASIHFDFEDSVFPLFGYISDVGFATWTFRHTGHLLIVMVILKNPKKLLGELL